jgi:hypothetical protein
MLDGSTYPGYKLVPYSLGNFFNFLEMPRLLLGIGNAI